jgi:hypothetical protein
MGLEPTNLLHAMQALYQLSYAPVGRIDITGGNPLLEPIACRTHVRHDTGGV